MKKSSDFWKEASLETIKRVCQKAKKGPKRKGEGTKLKLDIPQGLMAPLQTEPLPTYLPHAKRYQVEGVEQLIALQKLGVAGVLGWPMGFGKTWGAALLILHWVSKGHKGNFLFHTPNFIRRQFKREVRQLIAKAKFFTHFASIKHWEEYGPSEHEQRLEVLDKAIFSASQMFQKPILRSQESELLKEAICLMGAFSEEEQKAIWLEDMQFDSEGTRSVLGRLAHEHIIKIFSTQLAEKKAVMWLKLTKLVALHSPHIKPTSDIQNLSASLQEKIAGSHSEHTLNFLSQLFALHPDYCLDDFSADNYPGKVLEEYLALAAFPGDKKSIVTYGFDRDLEEHKADYPRLVFCAYHEASENKKREPGEPTKRERIEQFVKKHLVTFWLGDEVHLLSGDGSKRQKVSRNLNMELLRNGIRKNCEEQNEELWLVPCSGTFSKGDFSEFTNLFHQFNPLLISQDDNNALIRELNSARSEFEHMLRTGEIADESIDRITLAYAHLLTLNLLAAKTISTFDAEDPHILQQWGNRAPQKKFVKIDMNKLSSKLSAPAKQGLVQCNELFKKTNPRSNINKVREQTEAVLRYCRLNPDNLDQIRADIARGARRSQETYQKFTSCHSATQDTRNCRRNPK